MTKKFILRLCLSVAFVLTLHSCQQELLQTEQEYTSRSQNFTLQRLRREELEQKHPQVLERLGKFVPEKSIAGKTIYTDAENGYSVDTEEAVYVEDANGNKTYTFGIKTSNTEVIENLVLQDIGNGKYYAYITQYDKVILQNPEQATPQQLKDHSRIIPVGEKTHAEVFGKLNPCQYMSPVWNYVSVAGHRCQSGDHDYSQLDDCNFKGTSGAPTPDTMQWVTTYTVTDGGSCGASTGGGVTTPPIGGGVGSGGGYNTAASPCAKLQALLNKPVVGGITPPGLSIGTILSAQLSQHIADNANNTNGEEKEINFSTTGGSNDITFHQSISSSNDPSLEVNTYYDVNSHYIMLGHDHTNSSGMLSIFSLTDIYTISGMIKAGIVNSNTYFNIMTSAGTNYYVKFDTTEFLNWINASNFFVGWDLVFDPGVMNPNKKFKEDEYEKDVKFNKTSEQNLIGFLNFFAKNGVMGIEMLEVKNDGTYSIFYDQYSKTITRKKCS